MNALKVWGQLSKAKVKPFSLTDTGKIRAQGTGHAYIVAQGKYPKVCCFGTLINCNQKLRTQQMRVWTFPKGESSRSYYFVVNSSPSYLIILRLECRGEGKFALLVLAL